MRTFSIIGTKYAAVFKIATTSDLPLAEKALLAAVRAGWTDLYIQRNSESQKDEEPGYEEVKL